MEAFVNKLFDKFWLEFKSIPIFIILCLLACTPFIPKKAEDDPIQLYYIAGICVVLLLFYCYFCYASKRLPRAKRGAHAVLFVIDAESDQHFQDIKNKLGSSFEEYINNSSRFSFSPVYVKKDSISHYDFNDEASMMLLLEKTRTMFVVDIRYRVDDISSAEKYEIRINLGVVHPTFNGTKNNIISSDLAFVQRAVSKKRFPKNHLLEQFDVTAQQLSLICKYIIGLVMLLQQQSEAACNLLREAHDLARRKRADINDPIYRLIENRFVLACLLCSDYYIDRFSQEKDLSYLDKMNTLLDEMNSIRPGLPMYYSKKAYYEIAKNHDARLAEEYVIKQKSIDSRKAWKYSEAFLAAYNGKSPMTIYKKYKNAFKVEQNLIEIVDYIEFILLNEPERFGLLLAAGLVYEELGDNELSHQYYIRYQSVNHNTNFEEILREKIKNTAGSK